MRHLLTLILTAFLALSLCGCQAITFDLDDLLSAPKVADEQSAIYEALIESAGRGITPVYPRSGDYRSAFVLYDIDGDSAKETLAFYSVSASGDSNVKMSVLDRDSDGKWRSQYEIAGAGNAVERVMFSGADMVVGYSAQDYEENAVRMYRYTGDSIETIYEGTYSVLETADSDGCGNEEIAVVRRSGLGVEVEMLKTEPDGSYTDYGLQLEESAASIPSCVFGEYAGRQAMYLDVATDSGSLITEIIYLDGQEIVCPTASGGLSLRTQRPAGYFCRDYDNDGAVEIPTLTPFTGYESAPWGEGEYLTEWLSISDDGSGFETKSVSYTNLRDGYLLTIPNRWQNLVTVSRDQGTGEVTFYSYILLQAEEDLTELVSEAIMSFAAAERDKDAQYAEAGYSVLYQNEFRTYWFKTLANPDMPLILTTDEIKDNFYILE